MALGVGDGARLSALAGRTSLVVESSGTWRLHDVGRQAGAAGLRPGEADDLRVAAATLLAADDPLSAIDVLLDAGATERAADLLATNLSEVGETRAVRWLYRMPAAVRRRFPPVLTAGRATVDLDAAREEAERRLEAAATDDERGEALLALGSAMAAAAELGGAAEVLEGALGGCRVARPSRSGGGVVGARRLVARRPRRCVDRPRARRRRRLRVVGARPGGAGPRRRRQHRRPRRAACRRARRARHRAGSVAARLRRAARR